VAASAFNQQAVELDIPSMGESPEICEVRERHNRAKLAEHDAMRLLDSAKEARDVHQIRLALDKVVLTQERARDAAEELRQARAAGGLMVTRTQHNQTVERMAAEFQRGMEALVNKSPRLVGLSAEQIHEAMREETGRCYESIRLRMVA
jgi:spermidine synthase